MVNLCKGDHCVRAEMERQEAERREQGGYVPSYEPDPRAVVVPASNQCSVCTHYHKHDDAQGFCRRYPPSVPAMNFSQFPPVKADMGCGEFKAR